MNRQLFVDDMLFRLSRHGTVQGLIAYDKLVFDTNLDAIVARRREYLDDEAYDVLLFPRANSYFQPVENHHNPYRDLGWDVALSGIAIGDVNMDGYADVIFGTRSKGVIYCPRGADVYEYVDKGTCVDLATFTVGPYATAGGALMELASPAMTDYDGDGDLDMFVGCYVSRFRVGELNDTICPPPSSVLLSFSACKVAANDIGFRWVDELTLPVRDTPKPGGCISWIGRWTQYGPIRYAAFNTEGPFAAHPEYQLLCQQDIDAAGLVVYFENMRYGGDEITSSSFSFLERPEITNALRVPQGLRSIDGQGVNYKPIVVDWDGDNDNDLIVGSSCIFQCGLLYFERMSSGLFVEKKGESNPLFGFEEWPDIGRPLDASGMTPVAVDWNQDGLLDLLILGWPDNYVYLQATPSDELVVRGGDSSPFFAPDGLPLTYGPQARPLLVNWDYSTDGSLEMFVTSRGKNWGDTVPIDLYEQNPIDGSWSMSENRSLSQMQVQINIPNARINTLAPEASLCAFDWDGDTKMDLLVGTNDRNIPYPKFYKGKDPGSGYCSTLPPGTDCPRFTSLHFELQSRSNNPFIDVPDGTGGIYWEGPNDFGIQFLQVVDWDGDNDLDLIAKSLKATHAGICLFLYQTTWSDCLRLTSESLDDLHGFTVADWDGDGDYDLIVGNNLGYLKFFLRDGPNVHDLFLLGGTSQRRADTTPLLVNAAEIAVDHNAAPQMVDVNGDSALDLIVGDQSGHINVYVNGFCESVDPCFMKGVCHQRTGRCQCTSATEDNQDCSGCAEGYFRTPTHLDNNHCQRCPSRNWDPYNPICHKRGVCNDDRAAKIMQQRTSSSLAMIARGTGNCTCNDYFAGNLASPGATPGYWAGCFDGECPAGRELTTSSTGPSTASESCSMCAPGKAKNISGNVACTDCTAGKFANSAGATQCSPCQAGYYSDTPGSIRCIGCAIGTYQSSEGQQACQPCPAGTSTCLFACFLQPSGFSACYTCPGGTYSEARAEKCDECSAGRFSADGASACTACELGKFSLGFASECTPCPEGRIASKIGSVACETCDSGTKTNTLQSACEICPAGYRSPSLSSVCWPCPAGAISDVGAAYCTYCEAGRFTTNGKICERCAAGRYSTTIAASDCISCQAGKYSITGGAADEESCQMCALGKYSGDIARTLDCEVCPLGSSTSSIGQTQLFDCLCSPGREATLVGNNSVDPSVSQSLTCALCNQGRYKTGRNHDQCQSCDDVLQGGVTEDTGAVDSTNCYCSPGNYLLPSTNALDTCQVCPVGFYCPGLPTDYGKTQCRNGATTHSAGATQQSDCLCGPGWYKVSATECAVCPTGRYKTLIADTSSCPGECPPFSTSSAGSRSSTNCRCLPNYEDVGNTSFVLHCVPAQQAVGQATGTHSMAVPAVQGVLNLGGLVAPSAPLNRLTLCQDVANQLAEKMGVAAPDPCEQISSGSGMFMTQCGLIDISFSINPNVTNFSSSAINAERRMFIPAVTVRRLQSSLPLSYTVRVPTQATAIQKAAEFRPAELLSGLRETSTIAANLISVSSARAPEATQALTTCPATRAFPAGAAFVSIAVSCQCMAGYEPSSEAGELECKKCRTDYYKQQASNSACTACGANRGTFGSGANTSTSCFCKEGYHANIAGVCVKCPPEQYCPFDRSDDPIKCPTGTETLTSRRSIEDCLCSKGWGMGGGECAPCSSGTFSDAVANLVCRACPQNMQSPNFSTDIGECSCKPDYYYAWSKKLQSGRCELCNVPGIICDGGLYNDSLGRHVEPYADVDYYLTGQLRAVKCRIEKDLTSYCMGGHEQTRPCLNDCSCREGHDGFLCQNCKTSYTRDRWDLPCRDCKEVGSVWWMILVLNLMCMGWGILYIILASMAAAAGQSTQRVHTALLRLWQSWVLSMVCLQQFDFSEVELFKWSMERARASYLAKNPASNEEDEARFLSSLRFDFPPWFQRMADWVYGVNEFLVKIGSPTEIMNCLSEKILSEEDAEDYRHYWHALWWTASPIILLLWTLVLSYITVHVLFPRLHRKGWFPPANPIEFGEWSFNLLKPKILKAIRIIGCDANDEDEILAEMRVLYRNMNFGMRTLKAVALNPVDGLGAVLERLNYKDKDRAKRVVCLIFLPKAKKAMQRISEKFFSKKAENADEKKRESAFKNPWAKVAIKILIEALDFHTLAQGLQAPMDLIQNFTATGDGKKLAYQLLQPAFRIAGMFEGVDVETLDEVWPTIQGALADCSFSSVAAALTSNGDALDALTRVVTGKAGSIIYVVRKKPAIVAYFVSEAGGRLEGDELYDAYRKVLKFAGSIILEEVVLYSPAALAAKAASSDLVNQDGQLELTQAEKEEKRIKEADDWDPDIAEGFSGNIADYPVLGIWRKNPHFREFLLDSRPLILIALYTMWYEITKQLLLLNHCEPFAVEDGSGLHSVDLHWMKHTNWICYKWGGKHVPVAFITAVGLVLWSSGTLLGLGFLVFRNRRRMSEPGVSRLYAYFVQGYEIEYCWWDVVIKRLDLLCTITITYTNIAPDRRAKLLCYTALAACVLILHAGYSPFDNRKNKTLDRYEYLGLLVRFMTYTVIQLLLVFNPGIMVAAVCAAVIGFSGTFFFISMWTTICVEFISDAVNRGGNGTSEELEEAILRGLRDDNTNLGVSPARAAARCCRKCVSKTFVRLFLWLTSKIGKKYAKMERNAFAINFGDGELRLATRAEHEAEEQWAVRPEGIKRRLVSRKIRVGTDRGFQKFFRQNDSAQREYLAHVIGDYYVHVLCTMGSDALPPHSLEYFLILCASMKAAQSNVKVDWLSKNVEEKFDLIMKGIPEAVKRIKGECEYGREEQDENFHRRELSSTGEHFLPLGSLATLQHEPDEFQPLELDASGPRAWSEVTDPPGSMVEHEATKDMLHPPSPDVAASKPTPVPPSEFRHPAVVPLPPPIEPPGLVADTKAAMSKEIDPIGEEVDECDSLRSAYSLTMSQPGSLRSVNQQDADDLRSECSQVKVAKVASFRSVQASSFLPPQHTMSTKSMDSTATGRGPLWPHLEDSRAAVRQSGYGRNSTQIHEKMMENRVKGELEKLRLRAEDLNETLMMLYRVTHTRVNAAFAKIEEEWNNTCVQQDATRLWWDDAHDLGCTQMYGAAKWNSSDCGTEVGLQGDASSAAHVLGVTNQMEKQQDDEVMLSHPLSSPLRCAGDPGEGLDHMRLQTPSREAETSRSASIEEVFSGILESDSAESSACKKAPPAFTFERCRGQRSGSGGRVALSPGTAREEAHSTDGTSGGKEAVQGTDFVEEPPEVDIKTQDLPTRRATWAPHASGSLAWD